MQDILAAVIAWQHSGDSEFPFAARYGELELNVRINDLPAEPLYTLIADGSDAAEFDDWPASWIKPTPA